MLKFSFRREKDKEFKHIAHGLIPAASIAPKPAVPRTPPPRSPNPSPERPRSALAAAILSSSLTGQTWAIPPARPRSLSESGQSESFASEPNISAALYTRDKWSEDLVSRPCLPSPDQSEGELEDKEEDGEEHVYQTLDRRQNSSLTESVYALPLKAKSPTPRPRQRSHRREPSPAGQHIVEPNERTKEVSTWNRFPVFSIDPSSHIQHDFTEETSGESPEVKERKMSVRKSPENWRDDAPCRSIPTALNADHPRQASQAKSPKHLTELPPEPASMYSEVRKKAARDRREKNTRMVDKEKLLEERLQHLEREIRDSKGFSNQRCPAGSEAELQNLRQHAQELVDENDALKLTVHRLNVELSHYQARFRPLSKEEHSKVGGLPNTGSPPPWLVDMKYLSPLLLAYEDRMNEKDALLQTTEEDMKKLRVQLEEAIKENEKLHDEVTKTGAVSQKDCHQLQQQAFLVLQENQVLIDQLEAQRAEAQAAHSKHNSEVTKVSKQLMLLEVENQRLQEDLEESRREVQKNMKELQVLQARLQDAVTWDEHCSIAGKLRRQLEQQENRNKSEMDKLLLRVSNLQEENRFLVLDKAHLAAKIKATEAELELSTQASRKAERRMSVLKRQKEECVSKEEKTRHYLGAVISVAEHMSQERDRLLHMASSLQQEKQKFVSRILSGTVRFGKLQEEVKVYRSQASTRLAALEEAAEGRTASYQREILHLQRLLRERQEAEEKLLQSKREIEEELEVVWQAATRENQQMRESLWDSELTGNLHSRPAQAPDEITTSPQHQHKHGLDFYC